MRAPVPAYLILSKNVLHESLQKLILRFVAGLLGTVSTTGTIHVPVYT